MKKVIKTICLLGFLGLVSFTNPCVVGAGPYGNSVEYCIEEAQEESELFLVGEDPGSLYLVDGFDDCAYGGFGSVVD